MTTTPLYHLRYSDAEGNGYRRLMINGRMTNEDTFPIITSLKDEKRVGLHIGEEILEDEKPVVKYLMTLSSPGGDWREALSVLTETEIARFYNYIANQADELVDSSKEERTVTVEISSFLWLLRAPTSPLPSKHYLFIYINEQNNISYRRFQDHCVGDEVKFTSGEYLLIHDMYKELCVEKPKTTFYIFEITSKEEKLNLYSLKYIFSTQPLDGKEAWEYLLEASIGDNNLYVRVLLDQIEGNVIFTNETKESLSIS